MIQGVLGGAFICIYFLGFGESDKQLELKTTV